MTFIALTLFPDMITQGINHSMLKRAAAAGFVDFTALDIRDFADNKHRQTDDYPYGGGCGMVMTPWPVYSAYLHAVKAAGERGLKPRTLYMTPRGRTFSQAIAKELAAEDCLILLCGHYEGIDERVVELIKPDEISLGDFVLTGGELASMAVIDAVTRLVPGVLGNEGSAAEESFSDGLLEYPQYTRPPSFMGLDVPEVLLSGHHERIKAWRREKALEATKERRPDLLP
ncbi:MAG: tRNA (guanosine(37)-N1)-methyltransferase TrmD [Clostridiales bacterium]|jgi:tRNA (guanine37-N1)-methyltransferase|nr:tRNA (guanosine(37)-N1)-methyltransferase TrmD [Clostridiales bacterium]